MHDIIGDIIDWDEAHKAYLADAGQTGERYNQRLEAARRMAEIEAGGSISPGGSTASRSGSRCTFGLSPMPHSR